MEPRFPRILPIRLALSAATSVAVLPHTLAAVPDCSRLSQHRGQYSRTGYQGRGILALFFIGGYQPTLMVGWLPYVFPFVHR